MEGNDAEVMNQEAALNQPQEQAAAAAAEEEVDDSVYAPLQRYDRVRFWKSRHSPHPRRSPHQHTNNEEDGFLGVVQELLDDDFFEISFNDGDEVTIHRACIELVMPAALWVKEAFKRWCQKEIIDTSRTFFVFPNGFQFQGFEYENISLDDEMASELENALRHNETFQEVRITIESPMLLQQVNRDRLNNLVRALLYLPKLRALCLRNMSDQDVVNAVFSNLGVARQLTHLGIQQHLLPNIQFSQHLWNAGEQKTKLILHQPVITSIETSRNFVTRVIASKLFGCVRLAFCSADFVCLFLEALAKSNANVNCLEIWHMPNTASTMASNERTGGMGLFLETLRSCLVSRAENNLQPLHLKMCKNNINYHHFVDTLLLHDNVCHLDICRETVDDEVADAIGYLLKRTKKLQALELPWDFNNNWTCSKERRLEIINSISMNKSLHELCIGCLLVGILLRALCHNQTLEKLTIGADDDWYPAGTDDLEAMKHFTTLRELRIYDIRFNIVSVRAALRMNTSLEHVEIGVGINEVDCTNDDQVKTYLARNRWFHRNEVLLLKNPGSILTALWSHILARVSSNPTFLFKLTQANPDIFLMCRPVQQKRPRSFLHVA